MKIISIAIITSPFARVKKSKIKGFMQLLPTLQIQGVKNNYRMLDRKVYFHGISWVVSTKYWSLKTGSPSSWMISDPHCINQWIGSVSSGPRGFKSVGHLAINSSILGFPCISFQQLMRSGKKWEHVFRQSWLCSF